MGNISDNRFDAVIVGGGISGLGIAYVCSLKGLKVLLVDRGGIGEQTSSNSLRIIHGGFRYLQTLNLLRLLRSLEDQNKVLRDFSEHITPLPCYLPLKRWGLKSLYPVKGACSLYRTIGSIKGSKIPSPKTISREEAERELPWAGFIFPFGALRWHDLLLKNPKRFHAFLGEQITKNGGVLREHHQVVEVREKGDFFNLSIVGECSSEIEARWLIDSRGPWIREGLPGFQMKGEGPLTWVRAQNVVFEGNDLGIFGLALPSDDCRQYFLVGREGELSLGTEYSDFIEGENPGDTTKVLHMAQRLREGFSCLEGRKINRIETGILPARTGSGDSASRLLGSHKLKVQGHTLQLVSTKYTTFLSQGEEVVNLLLCLSRRR